MAINLSNIATRVESQGGSFDEVEVLGTLEEGLKDAMEVDFSTKNLRGDNRVVVFVYDDKDEPPLMFPCSKALSATIRKALADKVAKDDVLASLLNLRLVKNDAGVFISPDSSDINRLKVKDLKKKGKVSINDLVAF